MFSTRVIRESTNSLITFFKCYDIYFLSLEAVMCTVYIYFSKSIEAIKCIFYLYISKPVHCYSLAGLSACMAQSISCLYTAAYLLDTG